MLKETKSSILSRRDFLKITSGSLFAGLLNLYAQPALAIIESPPEFWHGRRDLPYIAITYDDCYPVKILQKVEQLLGQHPDIKVTFFPVGEALLNTDTKDPGIWQRIYQKGHEIGYHTFSHVNPGLLSNTGMLEDYDRWYAACAKVLGFEPDVRFARPPYGVLNTSFLHMSKERNLVVAMWSASWGGPVEKAKEAMNKVRYGDVVLMHISTQDLENSGEAFSFIENNGLRAVTMTSLYVANIEGQIRSPGCNYPSNRNRIRTCPE